MVKSVYTEDLKSSASGMSVRVRLPVPELRIRSATPKITLK
ncbi:hypothetical protein LAh6_55 [Aeromonas phage LAh_6]|uniref:Uncharacterized protein n=1 Tax=Aeromonas phage LAh_6 TaxID=2591030 RepID=A0A514A046_9CAUD|nr:hypothetical protein HWC30_gp055 [Aeromonas phage LAh_6]QDH46633.1 hypothetical protein LAh6_55 [Aeromonas phage LAh_6]